MKKFKFFIDYDREEKWLNEMAKKGYMLEDVSCGYKFSLSNPENATIRIDYRIFKNENDFLDYCTLFEDSGWRHIAGTKYSGTQYFKKISEDSDDDIFSDAISKAGRYKRLSDMWLSIAVGLFPTLVVLILTKSININAMFHPKSLYYTPGLWEMNGFNFWRHFLFETPFALGRGFIWTLIPLIMILYFYFSVKAKALYNKTSGK